MDHHAGAASSLTTLAWGVRGMANPGGFRRSCRFSIQSGDSSSRTMLAPTSRWGTSSSSTGNPQTISKPCSPWCPQESHSPCHHRWPRQIRSSAVQALPSLHWIDVRCSLDRLPPQHQSLTHCTTLPLSDKKREERSNRLRSSTKHALSIVAICLTSRRVKHGYRAHPRWLQRGYAPRLE